MGWLAATHAAVLTSHNLDESTGECRNEKHDDLGEDRFQVGVIGDQISIRRFVPKLAGQALRIISERYGTNAVAAHRDENRAQGAFAEVLMTNGYITAQVLGIDGGQEVMD